LLVPAWSALTVYVRHQPDGHEGVLSAEHLSHSISQMPLPAHEVTAVVLTDSDRDNCTREHGTGTRSEGMRY
jgi:hypothetical protein